LSLPTYAEIEPGLKKSFVSIVSVKGQGRFYARLRERWEESIGVYTDTQ
jgi:hypothetical protein